jgi:tRNA pseudouridine38-40 synthase
MRNLKLTLAYDGTDFHGWQIQPHLRTVQGELQQALAKLFNHAVLVNGSGRTDAGVHAHGQVANVETSRTMNTDAAQRGINALLPADIRVLQVEDVATEFHARRSAQSKTYEYRVWRDPIVSPFQYRYVYPFRYVLDEDAVDRGSAQFCGTNEFTSFCSTETQIENHIRTIYEAEWRRTEREWVFRIRGSGFLQHMVRIIVGTLLDIGQHRIAVTDIPAIFEARDRRRAGRSLPARGLHLIEVRY